MKSLVVDDDATSRFYLQEILKSHGEVHGCADGAEAVKEFERALGQGRPYQLICLDIMMPVVNGVQVLHAIRQAEAGTNRGPATKVLMATALEDSKTVVNAFREQCDGYLVKPIDKAKLLDRLRALDLIA